MAYTTTWDAANEAAPANTDVVSSGDDKIRELKVSIRERIAKDHYMDIAGTDADHGEHQKITFQSQIAKPTNVANKGFLYIKDVSAKAELHWEDEDANEIALTSAGALNISALLLTHLATIYPIGCIYTTTVITNPATVFGFGTWEAFGAGRVLVGVGTSDAAYAAAATGGASTVTLTGAQSGVPAHTHTATVYAPSGGAVENCFQGGVTNAGVATGTTSANSAANAASAHDNMPPYVVVYMWKRTA